MSSNLEIGAKGEKLAKSFLEKNHFTILESNWRFKRSEIDIIAKKNEALHFVEVKTRSSEDFGKPEEFLNRDQELRIMDAAAQYMEQVGHDWEFQFDIISIYLYSEEEYEVRHYPDAFFGHLDG